MQEENDIHQNLAASNNDIGLGGPDRKKSHVPRQPPMRRYYWTSCLDVGSLTRETVWGSHFCHLTLIRRNVAMANRAADFVLR
jgi:hypothetical protein